MRRLLILAAIGASLAAGIALLGTAGVDVSRHDVTALERRVPVRTALMRRRIAEARTRGRDPRVDQRWVPYARISPMLRRAVLVAEDDAFFSHGGLDWDELRASMQRNLEAGRIVRGGSTITQQLARNLYLDNERTLTRKLKEAVLAHRLERALTKRRIFELYLNLIEWGDGIYGIEAAAQRHFGVSAAALDARRSALLAAVIINPRRYDPVRPDRRIVRRTRMILDRLRARGFIGEAEYLVATGRAAPAPASPDSASVGAGGDPEPTLELPLIGPVTGPAPADTLPR